MFAYLITNKVSGKKYVGISRNAARRWRDHIREVGRNKKHHVLHKAMKKYGVRSFLFEVIACAKTWDDLLALERLLIGQHDSFVLDGHGYNMTRGGEGTLGFQMSPEHVEKLRLVNSTRIRTEAERLAISQRFKGKKKSPEQRAKLSAAHKAIVFSPDWLAALAAGRRTSEARARNSAAAKKRGEKISPDHPFLSYWKGRRHSLETRAKMSKAAKAIAGTEEFRERIRKHHKGVKRSGQALRNIQEAIAAKAAARRAPPNTQLSLNL